MGTLSRSSWDYAAAMFWGDSTGSSLPHAVDGRLRVVDELEEGRFHVRDVDAGQVHHRGEGIEVHDDATLTVYGCDVLGDRRVLMRCLHYP